MLDNIGDLIKEAMKAKDKGRLNALRYIKSLLIENKTASKPVDEQDVVIRHYKKINDSLELYKDDAEKTSAIQKELAVIKEFMPEEMDEAAVVALINEIKSSLDNPNMGAIMKELSPQIKGKFDGKRASQLVKDSL